MCVCDIKVQWELQRADAPEAFESLSQYFDVNALIVLQRCFKSNTPNN